jgi:hypothetical protein
MCGENRACLFLLLLGLLLVCIAGALRGEEPGPWYLISEAELRSIEAYRETSEAERQSWLLQARELRTRAGNSETRSAKLEAASADLNRQLARAREDQRRLEQSYSGLEAAWSAKLSSLNGELAAKALEAERHKRAAGERLAVIIILAGSWLVFLGLKAARFFRLIP